MYKLNLDLSNRELYRGCDIFEFEPGRFRLVTHDDSVVTIVSRNLSDILKMIPEAERDELVLTGAGNEMARMAAQAMLGPFFRKLFRHKNGGQLIEIPQPPHPPEHLQCEAE